jgi:hypothetical protein
MKLRLTVAAGLLAAFLASCASQGPPGPGGTPGPAGGPKPGTTGTENPPNPAPATPRPVPTPPGP